MTTDDVPQNEMTPEAFADLLDRYGPDLARWPEDLQGPARGVLDRSEDARTALREAEALATLLDQAPAGEVHAALTARVLAGAPGAVQKSADGWLRGVMGLLWPEFGWVRPAALMAASLVAGLYVGVTGSTAASSDESADLFAYVFSVPGDWQENFQEGDFE